MQQVGFCKTSFSSHLLIYNVFDYSDKDLEVILSKSVDEAKLGSVGILEAAETLHQDLAKFEGGYHMQVEEQVLDSEPGMGQPWLYILAEG